VSLDLDPTPSSLDLFVEDLDADALTSEELPQVSLLGTWNSASCVGCASCPGSTASSASTASCNSG